MSSNPGHVAAAARAVEAVGVGVEAEEAELSPEREAPELLQRITFHAMGCEMLAVIASQDETARAALESVPGWFEEWEQILSRFRIDSELSLLNRRPDQPVHVSDAFWDVYQAALWAEHFTEGLVTPTVAQAVIQAGYDRSFEDLPKIQRGGDPWLQNDVPEFMDVLADRERQTLCLPPGTQLDFGGVAKGWAAHQAMRRLESYGPALVDAAGDIAISRIRPTDGPWEIAVDDPFGRVQDLAILYLQEGGVATSGRDRRRWERAGQLQHHIIDPRLGRPASTDLLTVTIVAPTVMEAEAAAKAALIMGSERGMSWVQGRPTLAGLFVLEDGQVLASERMQAYL